MNNNVLTLIIIVFVLCAIGAATAMDKWTYDSHTSSGNYMYYPTTNNGGLGPKVTEQFHPVQRRHTTPGTAGISHVLLGKMGQTGRDEDQLVKGRAIIPPVIQINPTLDSIPIRGQPRISSRTGKVDAGVLGVPIEAAKTVPLSDLLLEDRVVDSRLLEQTILENNPELAPFRAT